METSIESEVTLLEGMAFRAASSTGHELTLDAGPDVGGAGKGVRPVELLLLGLAGCTGMDVISILRKMRQDVTGYRVRAHGVRQTEHPRVFTRIVVEHVVRGRELDPERVQRAVELSARRYCPVSAMLERAVALEERYRVIDEATGAEVAGSLPPPEDTPVG
jgi:putative redox protein